MNQIEKEIELRKNISNDFDHNYFIEAGAGAGKTSLVVDRITKQLKSGNYKPEEIVAITFTNKAAQELYKRIGDAVYNAYLSETDKKTKDILFYAYNDIEKMQISTIHSFCHKIIKENCFLAEVRPDFELIGQEDENELGKDFFKEWFNTNIKDFNQIKKDFDGIDVKVNYSMLLSYFLQICDLSDDTELIINECEISCSDIQKCEEKIVELSNDLITQFKTNVDEYTKSTSLEIIKDKTFENEKIFEHLSKDLNVNKISEFMSGDNLFKRKGKGITKEVKNEFDHIESEIRNKFETNYEDYEKEKNKYDCKIESFVSNTILEYLKKAREKYINLTFNKKITNDRILQMANKLLDKDEVLKKLRKTFKCIYVDEFQDTDPVQRDLILKIGIDKGNFIPGMLFLVGDVKQSIYRFRGADYRLFNNTKELFENNKGTCKVEYLNINNRSNDKLVNYYNTATSTLVDLIPEYKNMEAVRKTSKGSFSGVYRILKTDAKKISNDLVSIINSLVGNQSISDKETNELRKIKYSDFLILTPRAKGCSGYIDALVNANIPARFNVEVQPNKFIHLRLFTAIYSYFATPFYKRAKENLLEIMQKDTSYAYPNINEGKLKEARKEIAGMSGDELLGWLLRQTNLYINSKSIISSGKIKRAQMQVIQMVDSILEKGITNAQEIASELKKYIEESNRIDRELGYDSQEDVVRLMNVHKAKGLEGNIVIIVIEGDDERQRTTYNAENSKGGYDSYQVVSLKDSFSTDLYASYIANDEIRKKAELEEDKEKARLEYVAVTRAKEALIFVGKECNSYSTYIKDASDLEINGENVIANNDECTSNSLKKVSIACPKLKETTKNRVSPSNVEKKSAKKSNIDIEDDEEIIGSIEPINSRSIDEDMTISEMSEVLEKRPSGDIFGTVMHRAFELAILDMKSNIINRNSEICINRAINENNDDITTRFKNEAENVKKEYRDYLSSKIDSFYDFFSNEIKDAKEVYTEYPFSLTIRGKDIDDIRSMINLKNLDEIIPKSTTNNSLWINGRADLIIVKDDIITIWDYKSDKKDSSISSDDFMNNIHDKYDNQMALYKWVFGNHRKNTVEGKFYSIEIGEV